MKNFFKKYALTIALVTSIILTFITTTTFAETKWATLCGFTYDDGINTSSDAYDCANYFNSAGYYSVVFNNASAQSIYIDLPTQSIFFFSGHGDAGSLRCWNGSATSRIYAWGAAGMQNDIGGDYFLNKAPSLSKIKIAIFGGCNTANDGISGNLLAEALSRGIQTSIGWTTTVDETKHSYWLRRFSYYLSIGYIAGTAANQATTDTSNHFWTGTGGTTNYRFNGNLFNKIV